MKTLSGSRTAISTPMPAARTPTASSPRGPRPTAAQARAPGVRSNQNPLVSGCVQIATANSRPQRTAPSSGAIRRKTTVAAAHAVRSTETAPTVVPGGNSYRKAKVSATASTAATAARTTSQREIRGGTAGAGVSAATSSPASRSRPRSRRISRPARAPSSWTARSAGAGSSSQRRTASSAARPMVVAADRTTAWMSPASRARSTATAVRATSASGVDAEPAGPGLLPHRPSAGTDGEP